MTRILFVDDDVLTLQLMSRIANLLGYQSIVCYSAREGLRVAAQENLTMIIVDMHMGDMDGMEFVRKARQNPKLSHLPVIICSAEQDSGDEERAIKVGANAFLTKPLGPEEMLDIVKCFTTWNGKIDA